MHIQHTVWHELEGQIISEVKKWNAIAVTTINGKQQSQDVYMYIQAPLGPWMASGKAAVTAASPQWYTVP